MPTNGTTRRSIGLLEYDIVRLRSGSCRFECQRDAVYAIAQTSGLRAIAEHIAEMSAAATAMNLGPGHEKAGFLGLAHRMVERRPETRPARSAVELRCRGKEVEAAAGAGERARPLFM